MKSRATPPLYLLQPVYLLAIAVMVLNNWWLKPSHLAPELAGKLSDVAIAIFLPAALCQATRLAGLLFGSRVLTLGEIAAGLSVTALIMVLLETCPPYVQFYSDAIRFLRSWPLFGGWNQPPSLTADWTDLLVLPFLLVPWRLLFAQRKKESAGMTPEVKGH